MEALNRLDIVGTRYVSIRKAFGGSQNAIFILLITAAKRLCAESRIRVGLGFVCMVFPSLLVYSCC